MNFGCELVLKMAAGERQHAATSSLQTIDNNLGVLLEDGSSE